MIQGLLDEAVSVRNCASLELPELIPLSGMLVAPAFCVRTTVVIGFNVGAALSTPGMVVEISDEKALSIPEEFSAVTAK